ncbi:PEP-CTERM sorting domain-containing protein [Rhodopirellula halodulae]|uniref:PEP-CTERM sorting domain-containing protein n=1 Tax=Rhodopirellula halodulae TaxID=2894198 RepID=UPI0034D713DD
MPQDWRQSSTFGAIKTLSDSDLYSGGEYYRTIGGGSDFSFGVIPSDDWLFELEGTAVPEPANFGLLSIVLGRGVLIRRRRASAL